MIDADELRFTKDIIEDGEYAKGLTEEHYKTVIDVGAHRGVFTEYIYPKSDIIYALEPEESNFNRLLEKIGSVGMQRVEPFRVAIGNKIEVKKIYSNSTSGGYSIIGGQETGQTTIVLTLGQFMQLLNIETVDLLKVDVEGAEQLIFTDEGFGDVKDKVRNIVGEVHAGSNIENYLLKNGFTYTQDKNVFYSKKI